MPLLPSPRPYSVRNSRIHGRGVFATRTIRKGTTILEYRGERTTWKIARSRPDSEADNPHHTFIFEVSDGSVIDADVRGNAARWINHSCDPNCDTYEDDEGRVYIEAQRTIRAGEELTYDYQLTYDGRIGPRVLAAYKCRCGAASCRGSMLAPAARRSGRKGGRKTR